MLRLKTLGEVRTRRRGRRDRAVTGVLAAGLLMAGCGAGCGRRVRWRPAPTTQTPIPIAESKIALAAPVTYDNKWELYAGINFMNFMAGQNLPKRMNLGGGEFLGTYWLEQTGFCGILAWERTIAAKRGRRRCLARRQDCRYNARPAAGVYEHGHAGSAVSRAEEPVCGVEPPCLLRRVAWHVQSTPEEWHPQQRRFRRSRSVYESDEADCGAGWEHRLQLSKKLAIRLSPDLILEHFGTETREFVAVSGGVVYRFGKK